MEKNNAKDTQIVGAEISIPPRTACLITGAYWAANDVVRVSIQLQQPRGVAVKTFTYPLSRGHFMRNSSDWPEQKGPDEYRVNFALLVPADNPPYSDWVRYVMNYHTHGMGVDLPDVKNGNYTLKQRWIHPDPDRKFADYRFRFYIGKDFPEPLMRKAELFQF